MSFDSLLVQAIDTLNRALSLVNGHFYAVNNVSNPSIHTKAIAHDMAEIKLNISHALSALTIICENKKQPLVLVFDKTTGNKKAD